MFLSRCLSIGLLRISAICAADERALDFNRDLPLIRKGKSSLVKIIPDCAKLWEKQDVL
jgi:hypothetical protein